MLLLTFVSITPNWLPCARVIVRVVALFSILTIIVSSISIVPVVIEGDSTPLRTSFVQGLLWLGGRYWCRFSGF